MPFVRFSRDKRGYEHLYLIDTGRDRSRSRVLYWFRTPPGVRVGRNPFDLETQKALERQNPDVHFDWAQIVAAKIPPPTPVENWREKRRIEKAMKRARAEDVAVSDREIVITSEEPLTDTVEVSDVVDVLGQEHTDGPPLTSEGPSVEDQAAPPPGEIEMAPGAVAPATGTSDRPSGPVPTGRRRRRRRGRRRPRSETGQAPAADGELDPPSSDSSSSNEE